MVRGEAFEHASGLDHGRRRQQVDQAAVDRVRADETAAPRRVGRPQLVPELSHAVEALDPVEVDRTGLERIVQVVECRCDPVGEPDDLSLERRRESRTQPVAWVLGRRRAVTALEDPLADRVGEVQPRMLVALLDAIDDAQALPRPVESAEVAEPGAAPAVELAR